MDSEHLHADPARPALLPARTRRAPGRGVQLIACDLSLRACTAKCSYNYKWIFVSNLTEILFMPCKFLLACSLTTLLAGSALADSRPRGPSPDLGALPANAAAIYKDTTLFPREAKWLAIPWTNDVKKAIAVAKE